MTTKPPSPVEKARRLQDLEEPHRTERDHDGRRRGFFQLRREPSGLVRFAAAMVCFGMIIGTWYVLTAGPVETRIIEPGKLPSLVDTVKSFNALWFERALTRNAMVSLWRVVQGFGFALIVGIPIGILAGCFPIFRAFLSPVTIFGRNVPVAALVPLTLVWFGLGEGQKTGFIFIATVSFIIFDATSAVMVVDQKYLDTAYTLGASRWQIIRKVLVPLAMPKIFTSIRLLFGLGFGYIILAEGINQDTGIGTLIYVSQRRGLYEHVYLSTLVIALLAFLVDRVLYSVGRYMFPYLEK